MGQNEHFGNKREPVCFLVLKTQVIHWGENGHFGPKTRLAAERIDVSEPN